jgi:hypothetical protein
MNIENKIEWKNKDYCPICNKKLQRRYEGLVCKNFLCPLYFKLSYGWVFCDRESHWSKKQKQINLFYSSNDRLRLMKRWIEFKLTIIRRDNYTCQKCKFEEQGHYSTNNLCVHHIIPAHKEFALFFDKDNCVTLCFNCHKEIHKGDKRSAYKSW